jgi:SSS family solute:Na+ symporter
MAWSWFHSALAIVYFAGLLVVGFLVGRRKRTSNQFLNATGALPLWICIVACIAANCGSLDVVAMMALGAQYGMVAAHFYWIGAIPALVVLAFWLLPAYSEGRYTSILDFINNYYGRATRAMLAACMALMMLLLSGVCLCAVAEVLVTFLGCSFLQGILVTTPVVLFYTWAGGFRATVYSELLHFSLVLVAIVPLAFLVVREFGGVRPMLRRIPAGRLHVWRDLPMFSPHATMDRFGLVVGLGLVLSFAYWSTDFVLMQRMLAARRSADVRLIPLALAGAKLVFAFLIVLPGVVAPVVLKSSLGSNWNRTLPAMMMHYYKPSWIVIGIMGLAASLLSTFANNVSGFSAAWVEGIYRPSIHPGKGEAHYVQVGKITSAVAILISIAAAYAALQYQSLMEYMQMIFSTFSAPLFALVVVAWVSPKRRFEGGLVAFISGVSCAIVHQMFARMGVLHYGSQMSANFYGATLAFGVTVGMTLAVRVIRPSQVALNPAPRVRIAESRRVSVGLIFGAAAIATLCAALNVFFW